MKSIGVVIRGGMNMNKKVLTSVVLGIVSSGYFSTISEAVMLDTVYVEADRIHEEKWSTYTRK